MEDHAYQIFNRLEKRIKESQDVFEVYMDEEFLNSPHTEEIREARKDYFRILIPKTSQNLIEVYTHPKKKRIDFVILKELKDVKTEAPAQSNNRKKLEKSNKESMGIGNDNIDVLHDYAYTYIMDLLGYAIKLHPEYDVNNKWNK